ncbi:uncharacterized protein PHACADRAFT_261116 [Phanerochaete carnosa HHB-10118-sp]|uniref:Bromodomain associated domain-containing protein n=1 Tax=Phanerochaete carnosa (strain HHB-10118-sp) TaxID=650164 RepID=K5VMA8_PHACS|nr:uncharacterized protein PHACADRAFT_261116 [Phanerochaete carnosa HHB-10118-sp]EKM52593.1 hypothetical protein PHACADRAFT_261116 [Phanerochaete carnosa HHB-10118-sp]
MDAGAKKLLETATIEALHAHHFSKSSTQATNVLTDLLSRYLQVLASTCAKYAEHAGRLRLTARDAVCALDELGVGVEELNEYCATEGKEMARYAIHTARRLEDLNEFRAALSVGLREDRDDAMHLVYMPVPEDMPTDEEVSEEESESEEALPASPPSLSQQMNVDVANPEEDVTHMLEEQKNGRISSPRPLTPMLPLSPISNPSTPPRKRPRTSGWNPPPHIPDFLPPFPSHTPQRTPSPPPISLPPAVSSLSSAPLKPERPITPPPDVALSTADYKNRVPHNISILASQPLSSLPVRPISPPSPPPPQLALPEIQQSLYQAYHYALTHPPPMEQGPTNPARYKVAVALIEESQKNPRWEPLPSVYGISGTNMPRVSSIGPWYPIAIDEKTNGKGKETEEPKFPPHQPRPIMYQERVAPLVSQQGSRIPALAQKVLPINVLRRTTRFGPPLPLVQDGRKLTYGPGVSASWNSGPQPPQPQANGATKDGMRKEKGDAPPAKPAPDAKLYATWNWEQKTYRDPVRRQRVGSVSLSGTIGNGRRRSDSHVER